MNRCVSNYCSKLTDFSRTRPIRIALVNRKGEERLYFANCSGCAITDGRPIPSPGASLTPCYYSNDHFPAWFRLSQIELVSRDDFLGQFPAVPDQDRTLYEVIEGRVIPSRTWNLNPMEARGEAILHISDLHFGEDHGYPLTLEAGRGLEISPLVDVLIDSIQANTKVLIGAVVASGDFVTKGDANAYPHAGEFLRDLLSRLKLERRHCILVPGNHDLWTMNVEHPMRRYPHETPYRDFLSLFHLEEIQDLERITRIRLPNKTDLVFVALNSARIRNEKIKEYGYVSRHRYDNLLRYLHESLLADRSVRKALLFAVLHHHVAPVTRVDIPDGVRPVGSTLDAGELIRNFCESHVGYVLHGHQHIPFVGSVSRLNIANPAIRSWDSNRGILFVLGCGTTGAKRERFSDEFAKNAFAIYTPKDDHLDVSIFPVLAT